MATDIRLRKDRQKELHFCVTAPNGEESCREGVCHLNLIMGTFVSLIRVDPLLSVPGFEVSHI
jgi:hypothetical protein